MEKIEIRLLAEFESVVDLDLAMFKYIKNGLNNQRYIDQEFINLLDEKEIIKRFLEREYVNPLTLLITKASTNVLYQQLLTENLKDILPYATAYDTFGLLVAFLRETNYTKITILCENTLQEEFIHTLNDSIHTIVASDRKNVVLNNYDVLYMKYYANALLYDQKSLEGKHIYIANARYNLEEKMNTPLLSVSVLVSDLNIIHLMDLYTKVKYIRAKSSYDKKVEEES